MKTNNKNNILFHKIDPKIFTLILVIFLIFITISFTFCYKSKIQSKKLEQAKLQANKENNIFSLNKIYCCSSASATNNNENNAMWDLNVSQYTDIALYLKINTATSELFEDYFNENSYNDKIYISKHTDKNTISQIYIDNIKFSNNDSGILSLTYIPFLNIGSTPNFNIVTEQSDKIYFNIIDNGESLLNAENIILDPTVDKNLIVPISLRYLNYNLKTNQIVSNINEDLVFDGSILKRASVPLYSIKNEVSFTIHIINKLNEEYFYDVNLQIPLQNEDNSKNIYDGKYTDEKIFQNNYFSKKEN